MLHDPCGVALELEHDRRTVDVLRLETDVPHMVDPAWIKPLRSFLAQAIAS